MNKYIYWLFGSSLVVLCVALKYQAGVIDKLNAIKVEQGQIIEQQSQSIEQLKSDIAENARITLELSKNESEAREEANEIIKSIPKADKQSDAFNTVAPIGLLNFLRK